MTVQQIEKFIALHPKGASGSVTISFKTRKNVQGVFIQTPDYEELKKKNFWRIVMSPNLDDYIRTKSLSHARIFNGLEFSKLSIP
ncbi:short-chain dehydrogenase [Dinghuibacter silviterrae]|uniref:Uncharacterized protein n=1 Tax=Dinghuibacter silviterrae TaxID=1539049 RepID=A0A4V6QA03_9BACT|nr:short-chain dehydrogenase [Dinghuibacter silviterrae]TDX01453.1 hypothetical protein EDB95_2488 [Dinghuibacter silviterrae]